MMHGTKKSHSSIVPAKPANKGPPIKEGRCSRHSSDCRASHRIFPKSPCRPSPSLKRAAPGTPSTINASRPLYHS